MKLICPKCHYTGLVDATASAASSADESLICPRCGAALDQLLWNGSQPSTLTTATATAAVAVAPQRIMENQNAYAPSADTGFDDVLDIPSPLHSAEPAGEQMLVLEDVIPDQGLSEADEIIEPRITSMDEREDTLLSPRQDGHTGQDEPAAWAGEKSPIAGPQVYGASQTSSFDYEGGRAWLRIAPLLLLIGALVFFALYYLGNRINLGDRPHDTAANPAQPETQSAAPTTAPVESTSPAAQPSASTAVAVKEETQTPVEKPVAETARRETKPPVTVESKPPKAVSAPAPTAPVAEQATGNFTVQVGSYNDAAQADERAGRLRSSGVEARVVKAEIPRRGTWYRVQTGSFSSYEEAARYAAELKGKGATDSFLITGAQGH